MHKVDEPGQLFRIGIGMHPVTKIEYVARPMGCALENGGRFSLHHLPGSLRNQGIHIPLNSTIVSNAGPRCIEGDAPIDADG